MTRFENRIPLAAGIVCLGLFGGLAQAQAAEDREGSRQHQFIDRAGETLPADPSAAPPPAQLDTSLLDGNMPFQNAFVVWNGCDRPAAQERARREGQAGGRYPVDYSGISDCAAEWEALQAAIAGLPSEEARRQAEALIARTSQNVSAEAAQIYEGNNHE